MLSFSTAKVASFMVASQEIADVPTHFVGRTIVCPVVACTLCGFERPRVKHYCVAVVDRRPQLLEMCASLHLAACEAFRINRALAWPGLIVRCDRTSPHRSWGLVQSEWRPELISMAQRESIVELLSDLYRVPSADGPELLSAWIRRAGRCHAELQARSLLPGMA
jgi:hypothetical protein